MELENMKYNLNTLLTPFIQPQMDYMIPLYLGKQTQKQYEELNIKLESDCLPILTQKISDSKVSQETEIITSQQNRHNKNLLDSNTIQFDDFLSQSESFSVSQNSITNSKIKQQKSKDEYDQCFIFISDNEQTNSIDEQTYKDSSIDDFQYQNQFVLLSDFEEVIEIKKESKIYDMQKLACPPQKIKKKKTRLLNKQIIQKSQSKKIKKVKKTKPILLIPKIEFDSDVETPNFDSKYQLPKNIRTKYTQKKQKTKKFKKTKSISLSKNFFNNQKKKQLLFEKKKSLSNIHNNTLNNLHINFFDRLRNQKIQLQSQKQAKAITTSQEQENLIIQTTLSKYFQYINKKNEPYLQIPKTIDSELHNNKNEAQN